MEVLGEWVELTGGDWQGPVMLLGDLKILDFLFASQLPKREILSSPAVCMHAPVCIGLRQGVSPQIFTYIKFSKLQQY